MMKCKLVFKQFQILEDNIFALDEVGILWRRSLDCSGNSKWTYIESDIESKFIPRIEKRSIFVVTESD